MSLPGAAGRQRTASPGPGWWWTARQTADRGSASVYALAIGLCLLLAALGITVAGRTLVDQARARTAADLAALAAARSAAAGQPAACGQAARIAARNGAAVASCVVDGLDVTVTAVVGPAQAVARAGPVRIVAA